VQYRFCGEFYQTQATNKMFPIRQAAVAGRFYPADPATLRNAVESHLVPSEKTAALGCVVPHAGYIYSGHVAGAVFSRLQLPPTIILLCPNHTGRGTPLAINSEGAWETPLGQVTIDGALAESLKISFPLLAEDTEAHRTEHSAEVELPFLQVLRPDMKIVPIAIGTNQLEILLALGNALAVANTLIIASSDMNHYESDAITRIKDHAAIDKILALDPEGLYEVVRQEKITMCGVAPTVVMLTAAKKAKTAELVKYATSGDISQDRNTVVGYAGVLVK
jgi:MEMO1 family protein